MPSPAKIYGAEMTNDDAGIILKWRLESYSPINEYKVNLLYQEYSLIETPKIKYNKIRDIMFLLIVTISSQR